MKSITAAILLFVICAIGSSGCKPRETAITGQIFIVTKGAENIKLGGIQILLVEKSEAISTVRGKQDGVIALLKSRLQDLDSARQTYEQYQTKFRLKNKNPQLEKLTKEIDDCLISEENLVPEFTKALMGTDISKIKNLRMQQINQAEQITSCAKQWESWGRTGEFENEEIDLSILLIRAKKCVILMADSALDKDWLDGFSPKAIATVSSDAEGKFDLVCPHDGKDYVIFASAQRTVINATENYYWLVDVPTNEKSLQLFLNNNNLVSTDENNLFRLQ
jgi:hypothetical protein